MLGLRWNCSASPPSSRFALCFTKSSSSFALIPAPLRAFRASCWSQCSRSPNLVELEYADLNLKDFYGAGCQVGHVRIRQHVNPLSSSFVAPVKVPEWKQVFSNPSLPLMVDIGCGSGRFLIWLAKHFPESRNYLGLEIRNKLVQRSQFWVKELGLKNIHFMFANATISFEHLVPAYPGPLTLVSILCPDPHFKKRHHKRRVVQKSLVDSVVKNLSLGGQVSTHHLHAHMALNT
ncbi:tRNA (guanine-N-7) methyltransferase Trmb type protein [Dioscorea alata]|uniref:tRNA (Guanine-N-7) methyltransferase Trmb type protein n=1 Tax=Dioscorea alata TaxID=55571 RepID=A0ACB7UFA6_DIOAL|nr:tRNA (guanine-N-7) methyltransferase Trmb type protein [Dioscorea alata]